VDRKPRYVPPKDDLWKVFDTAQGQDKVMPAVAIQTAARRGEIFQLKWSDIDFDAQTITITTRKRANGSLERDVLPMNDELTHHLSWWRENLTHTDSMYVFVCQHPGPHYGNPFRERSTFLPSLCKKAGVPKFGFHGIRHFPATILYYAGEPVSAIQTVLRHKNPHTTTLYLKSLGLENVRQSMSKLERTASAKDEVLVFKKKEAPDVAESGA
jgi:integrase